MKKIAEMLAIGISLILLLPISAEAQLLKKIKQRAGEAAERTILNRTEREVSKGTDNAIDGVLEGGKYGQENEKSEKEVGSILKDIFGDHENNEEVSSRSKKGKSGSLTEEDIEKLLAKAEALPKDNNIILPETYAFGHELTVQVTNHQGSKERHYLLQPDESYYAQVTNDTAGKKYVIYDEANLTLLHFLEKQGEIEFWREKMSLFTVLRMTGIANGSDDTKVKNLAKKSILGYETHGYEIATGDGVLQLWLTHDAPATMFKTMFSLRAIQKESPFRPNDMIMEMKFTSTEDPTRNFSWSCTAFNPYTKSFNITDYEHL